MNQCIFMGRLTRDPETSTVAKSPYARFTLAVDRRTKRDGEPTADFPRFVVFGKLAETVIQHLHKGDKILVTSRLRQDSYIDKSGKKVYTNDFVVDELDFVAVKGDAGSLQTTLMSPAGPDPGTYGLQYGKDDEWHGRL